MARIECMTRTPPCLIVVAPAKLWSCEMYQSPGYSSKHTHHVREIYKSWIRSVHTRFVSSFNNAGGDSLW